MQGSAYCTHQEIKGPANHLRRALENGGLLGPPTKLNFLARSSAFSFGAFSLKRPTSYKTFPANQAKEVSP